jgi:hypothetical protein
MPTTKEKFHPTRSSGLSFDDDFLFGAEFTEVCLTRYGSGICAGKNAIRRCGDVCRSGLKEKEPAASA